MSTIRRDYSITSEIHAEVDYHSTQSITITRDSTITRGDCIKKNVHFQVKLKISDKYNPSLGTLRWKYQIMVQVKAPVELSLDLEK